MAGYTLKIAMENTHPPVWRRITVPDKITFYDLHRLIQIVFDWDDFHMHDFSIPKERIVIDGEKSYGGGHYEEESTLIDPFMREYKWIRYTYDFGDDWQHKIMIEKQDPEYTKRTATLLKWKGDHFCEDSGGLWGDGERIPFVEEEIKTGLDSYQIPVHKDLKEPEIHKDPLRELEELFKKFKKIAAEKNAVAELSAMEKMAGEWKKFTDESNGKGVTVAVSAYSSREYLSNLGYVDAVNYCKYLQISVAENIAWNERIDAIAQCIQEHPEYILYVLNREEYDELVRISRLSMGSELPITGNEDLVLKMLALGLVGFQGSGKLGEIRLAADLDMYLQNLDRKKVKRVYHEIENFDQRFEKILCMYGIIELDAAFEIYQNYYGNSISKEMFSRLIYWHARFQNLLVTGSRADGKAFICMKGLDSERVTELQKKYAEDMSYVQFPLKELQKRATDLSMRSDWVDAYFMFLEYEMEYPEKASIYLLEQDVVEIMNGSSLDEILYQKNLDEQDISVRTEVWECMAGMMLELELPMLKGRSRESYAREKDISPWQIGMVEKLPEPDTKKCRMYEFPADIQELMYEAHSFGEKTAIPKLLDLQKEKQIPSEEFLYLLAESCVTVCDFKSAENLIEILQKSSAQGKRAARKLEEKLKDDRNVTDDWEENEQETDWMWDSTHAPQQPFVRPMPKVGRNDPCPCGSGKKYKRCCGKNV